MRLLRFACIRGAQDDSAEERGFHEKVSERVGLDSRLNVSGLWLGGLKPNARPLDCAELPEKAILLRSGSHTFRMTHFRDEARNDTLDQSLPIRVSLGRSSHQVDHVIQNLRRAPQLFDPHALVVAVLG